MSKSGDQRPRPSEQQESPFECTFCGNTYLSREIPYNDLGYAVCPVCHYEHGPDTGSGRKDTDEFAGETTA